MKNFLIALSVFMVWAIFGLWLYSLLGEEERKTAFIKNDSSKVVEEKLNTKIGKTSKQTINNNDSIANNSIDLSHNLGLTGTLNFSEVIFKYEEGIFSHFNSDKIIIPTSTQKFIDQTKKFLIQHPSNEAEIISVYSPKENSVSPNYGIERGNTLKNILVSAGIPSKKIGIKSVIKDIEIDEDGYFTNSISINFKPLELQNILEDTKSTPENKIFYPDYASSGVLINKNLKKLAEGLKNQLTKDPDLKIIIVGHTDNVGSNVDNYGVGLKSSNQIKYYLQKSHGIDASRIKSISKGENEPLVPNNSKKSRNINRRIEINYTY